MRQTREERLAALTARTTELAKLAKAIEGHADAASASADSIRLTRVREVVTTLTKSVDALSQFRGALDANDPAGLATSVDDLLDRIQELRSVIERGDATWPAAPRSFSLDASTKRASPSAARKRAKRAKPAKPPKH
jgi:hypothetical protein